MFGTKSQINTFFFDTFPYHLRLRHKTAAISYLHSSSSLSSIISISCNLNLCKLMRGARWTRVKERAGGYSGRWPLERLSGLIWHPRNATSILFRSVSSNGSSSNGTSRTDKLTLTYLLGFASVSIVLRLLTWRSPATKFHITFSSTPRSQLSYWPRGYAILFILSVLWDIVVMHFWNSVKGLISTSALPEPMTTGWQHVQLGKH